MLSTIEGIGRTVLGFEATLVRRISMAGEANAEADGRKYKAKWEEDRWQYTSGKFFNKKVMALDTRYIGHVVRETEDKILVFGDGDDRYHISKNWHTVSVSLNVLIGPRSTKSSGIIREVRLNSIHAFYSVSTAKDTVFSLMLKYILLSPKSSNKKRYCSER